jgi:hypothetical protein
VCDLKRRVNRLEIGRTEKQKWNGHGTKGKKREKKVFAFPKKKEPRRQDAESTHGGR